MHERDAVHLGLTALIGWLGLYLEVRPGVLAHGPSFAYLAAFASEHTWAVFFLVLANAGVIGMITSQRSVRLLSIMLVATGHGVFAGCLIMSDASVWSGTYAIVACLGYYMAFRTAHAGL